MKMWQMAAAGAVFMIGMRFSGIVTGLIGKMGVK